MKLFHYKGIKCIFCFHNDYQTNPCFLNVKDELYLLALVWDIGGESVYN